MAHVLAVHQLDHASDRGVRREQDVVPIVIHGDAAFPGEGIVPETMNLSRLLERILEPSLQMTRADCGTVMLFEDSADRLDISVTIRLG